MKIYIGGKITGDPEYREKFSIARRMLKGQGHHIMDPSLLPGGFEYEDYMHVCFSMIDTCDAVLLLDCWTSSPGARREKEYAEKQGKKILYNWDDRLPLKGDER